MTSVAGDDGAGDHHAGRGRRRRQLSEQGVTLAPPIASSGLDGLTHNPGPPESGEADKPHFHGHRDRLRRRFLEAGAGALADYELLELVLFNAIPQRDVKPLAKALIARFGSFAETIAVADSSSARRITSRG